MCLLEKNNFRLTLTESLRLRKKRIFGSLSGKLKGKNHTTQQNEHIMVVWQASAWKAANLPLNHNTLIL